MSLDLLAKEDEMYRLFLFTLFVTGLQCHPLEIEPASEEVLRHPDDNLILSENGESFNSSLNETTAVSLPEPVDVSTSLDHQEKDASPSIGGVISHVQIDTDGVPVIEGVRMPDDPTDTKIWRNGRVLNNVFISSESSTEGASAIKDLGDMFIYRPASSRSIDGALNDGSFRPSQSDESFSPSLPYPAFYYQSYYNGKSDDETTLPDTIGVETVKDSSVLESSDANARGRIFFGQQKGEPVQNAGVTNTNSQSTIPKLDVNGTPAYFVNEEQAKSIYDDHGPYDYEPAQISESRPDAFQQNAAYSSNLKNQQQDYQYYSLPIQSQQQNAYSVQRIQGPLPQQQQQAQQAFYQSNYQRPQLVGNVAPLNSYVIQDQTYGTGPNSFTVPLPVPKDNYAQQLPQYQYQYRPQSQYPVRQSLGSKIASGIKGQFQKGADRLHDITAPVFDPIAEAGQKISANLGIPETAHKVNEKIATPGVLVPLAMAGGAALAIGALGTAAAINKNGKFGQHFNTTFLPKIENVFSRPKRSIDAIDQGGEDQDLSGSDISFHLLDDILSRLNGAQREFVSHLQTTRLDQWQEASCAQRIFCTVMAQQKDDSIALMEKRMATFLAL